MILELLRPDPEDSAYRMKKDVYMRIASFYCCFGSPRPGSHLAESLPPRLRAREAPQEAKVGESIDMLDVRIHGRRMLRLQWADFATQTRRASEFVIHSKGPHLR
jgi:hypothetical protein